jgi:hypothetical protein
MPARKTPAPNYRINPDIAARELKGELLFLRPKDRHLYTTNPSGQFIWRHLIRKAGTEKIVTLFAKEFDVTPEVASRDVRRFLTDLEKKQFLVRVAGT